MRVGDTRPFPDNDVDWLSIEPELINYDDLITTQAGVWIAPLLSGELREGSDFFPRVVAWRNEFYLEDGHTRIVRAILSGHVRGMVRVYFDPTQWA